MTRAEFFADCEGLPEEDVRRLCGALSGIAEADRPLLFELVFVDGEEIRALNLSQRGIDKITDVLSFPTMEGIKGQLISSEEHAEELDEADRLLIGSVVINKERAREQAEEYGHSFERELFYLAVHGVLHCLGYDHETEEERAEMRAKEEEVLRKMGLSVDGEEGK